MGKVDRNWTQSPVGRCVLIAGGFISGGACAGRSLFGGVFFRVAASTAPDPQGSIKSGRHTHASVYHGSLRCFATEATDTEGYAS